VRVESWLTPFQHNKGVFVMNLEEVVKMTPKKFALQIEEIVKCGGVTYMDAILDYCEKNNMEPDTVAPLISKPLKEKLEADARELNFLPRVATLPI
tara:strand:- start:10113 stop:10400 length:288 start_codon:yes stop_codon:yes gene_type:complete